MSKFTKLSFASLMLVMLGLSACAQKPTTPEPRQPSSYNETERFDGHHSFRPWHPSRAHVPF